MPFDTFGGPTPAQKAADVLATLFTAVALRVVLAQVGPGGEGGDRPPAGEYLFLKEFLEAHPLRNGDEWLAALMEQERGQMLGARARGLAGKLCRQPNCGGACHRCMRAHFALLALPSSPLATGPAGVRILEVRHAFCTEEFDWGELRQLAEAGIQDANVRLLRRHAAKRFGGSLAAADPPPHPEGGGSTGEGAQP